MLQKLYVIIKKNQTTDKERGTTSENLQSINSIKLLYVMNTKDKWHNEMNNCKYDI